MRKLVAISILVLSLVAGLFTVTAGAAGVSEPPKDEAGHIIYTEMHYKYIIEDGSICIIEFFGNSKDREKAVVPMSIAGYPVNYIAPGAFVGAGIQELWLPNILMMKEGELRNGDYIDEETKVVFYHKDVNGQDEETTFTFEKFDDKTEKETSGEPVSKTMGDFTYIDYGSYVVITGYNGKNTVVNVPSHIGSLPVKTVQGSAFSTRLYDEVRIPVGVSVDGLINAKKTVLNYDDKDKAITHEKTENETDAQGNTVASEDVFEIDLEQLESNEQVSREESEGESTRQEAEGTETEQAPEKNGNLWLWILGGAGGLAVLAGGVVVFLTAKKRKEEA